MDVPARRLHLGDKSSLPVQPLSGTVQSAPRVFQELHRSMSLLLFMSHRKIKKVTFSFLVRSLYYIECPLDFSFTLDGFMPCPTFRAVQRSRLDVSHDSPLLAPSVWPRTGNVGSAKSFVPPPNHRNTDPTRPTRQEPNVPTAGSCASMREQTDSSSVVVPGSRHVRK